MKQYCYKCQKDKENENFYKNKEGKIIKICKNCIDKEINNDIKKAIPFLELFNIPLLPYKWECFCNRSLNKPVFGKYLSFAKLKGIQGLGFLDSFQEWDIKSCNKIYIKNLKRYYIKYIKNKINL